MSFALRSLLSLSLVSFSFYGPARHRVLHSFPTRRSSDLSGPSLVTPSQDSWCRSWRPCRPERHQERSEEHTSELQSRGHLVCRLLLEKKKNEKTIINNEQSEK